MALNFSSRTFNTALLYDIVGPNDTDSQAVALIVSSVWNSQGTPKTIVETTKVELEKTYTQVSAIVAPANEYYDAPDGNGGIVLICTAKRTINVTVNDKTIAVQFSWDVVLP